MFFRSTKPAPTTGASRLPGWLESTAAGNGRPAAATKVDEMIATLQIELIGRSHVGKTALRLAIAQSVVNSHLPSGLFLSGGDPRIVARMLKEHQAMNEDLRDEGLATTIDETPVEYSLDEGDETRVLVRTTEAIGQILLHTTPDSPREQQQVYQGYLERLKATDVLWVFVPCPPPNPTSAEQDRFIDDLKITTTYVREALRRRTAKRPCSVAVLLTKIDTLYDNLRAAQHELTPELLRKALQPLVATISTSQKVKDGAILPVSAFGWQRALRSDETARENDAGWRLCEGATISPVNVDAVMIWTMLAALRHQEVACTGDHEPHVARIYRMLAADLAAIDPWVVPVKGDIIR